VGRSCNRSFRGGDRFAAIEPSDEAGRRQKSPP
jgi:hypothetical protein